MHILVLKISVICQSATLKFNRSVIVPESRTCQIVSFRPFCIHPGRYRVRSGPPAGSNTATHTAGAPSNGTARNEDLAAIRKILENETGGALCPSCQMPFDKGKKRKLIDACGHERCYSCMFRNEACPHCQAQKTSGPSHPVHHPATRLPADMDNDFGRIPAQPQVGLGWKCPLQDPCKSTTERTDPVSLASLVAAQSL
uniref:RING-type domain-containing protein n=1 Tax=Anopheles culicifacies TaxID=139723 RepID=A0A182M7T8_9DIPT